MHLVTPTAVLALSLLIAACDPAAKTTPDTVAAAPNRVTIKAKCESDGTIDFSIKPFKARLDLSNGEAMTWRQNGNDNVDVALYAKPGSPWPFDDDTLRLTDASNGELTVSPKAGTTADTVRYAIQFMCPGGNNAIDTLIVDPEIIVTGIMGEGGATPSDPTQ